MTEPQLAVLATYLYLASPGIALLLMVASWLRPFARQPEPLLTIRRTLPNSLEVLDVLR